MAKTFTNCCLLFSLKTQNKKNVRMDTLKVLTKVNWRSRLYIWWNFLHRTQQPLFSNVFVNPMFGHTFIHL